ncbi:hypothetical protein EDC32_1011336 [Laceyella sacchari]|jgi:hypothetical protein|uniref:hypothetical protein n=1 Tax=Laceyella sacchari TaxID=37482 RepID=UPI001042E5FD|nr:hypothetical protein [Laceyella sacchari]TCW41669.1 hypothetical protein EDC32_1011336 [Laceyella sacchari]
MKTREMLPGHLLYDIFDSDLSVDYLIESYEEWRQNWRQVPHFVSDSLEWIAAKYGFDQHRMEDERETVLELIKEEYPEVWAYLHPDGSFSKYHYDYARSAFWCRYRLRQLGLSEEIPDETGVDESEK